MQEKCDRLLSQWKDRFDQEKFDYLVAPPFVIAGDGGAKVLAAYRDHTILTAARALKQMYFKTEPVQPVLILLFESPESYKRLAGEWFDDDAVPHFGFFRHDNIMLMNVATGTGTLVHELTHALMKPDFPRAPGWFNEGLASLYEQCSLHPTIQGHANWRLAGLQQALKTDNLRPLQEMIEDTDFYDEEHVGLNYAQARYLMFYLQEKRLLAKYYEQFRDNVEDDPTGLKTLEKIIESQNLNEFEKNWRAWVMTLEFR